MIYKQVANAQRSKLRKVLKTPKGYEAHHLVPVGIMKSNKWVEKALAGGFDFNGAINGINLRKYKNKAGTHSNHPEYDKYVDDLIELSFDGKNRDIMSPKEIRVVFENTIVPKLRNIAERAENSSMSLNDFIKVKIRKRR